MKESEKIEQEDSTNGEEERVSKGKGNGELGKRRTEKFTDKRNVLID